VIKAIAHASRVIIVIDDRGLPSSVRQVVDFDPVAVRYSRPQRLADDLAQPASRH
jgi:hypothetical protein